MTLAIVALLLLILAGQRVLFVQAKRQSGGKQDDSSLKSLLIGDCMYPNKPDVAEVTVPSKTSGFSDSPDFLSHAKKMESRGTTPAKKMESMMAENDQARRKLRTTLIKGG